MMGKEATNSLPPELQELQDSRQSVYGPWRDNMLGTSAQMGGLLLNYAACCKEEEVVIPDWWAPLMMVAIKLNRIASGNFKQDNFDDLIVYLHMVMVMQQEADK